MAHYNNNAMVLKTDGSIVPLTIVSSEQITKLIGCDYFEMIHLGGYPITTTLGHDKELIDFMRATVDRAATLPPPPLNDYDFHRIDHPAKIQMFIHELGALIPLPVNPFFGGQLYGDVVILGQCIDEICFQ
jgi:hypothetical protein